jgi:hypothetical protein
MKLLDIILEDENKEKLIKKAKTIYKGVKTGILRKGVFGKVMYVLPDEYDIQIDVHNDIFIKLGNNRTKKGVKFYYVSDDDGEMKPLRVNPTEYQMNLKLIEKKKFTPFDIIIWWEESYPTNEPEIEEINENEERELKKVKAVFKAFKFTLYRKIEDYSYYFQLPDHVKIVTDEPGVKEFKSLRRYGDDIICVQVGHDGENSSVKSFKKKDGEDKLIKLDLNAGKYMHLTAHVNEKLKPFNIKVVYKGRNGKWD